MAAERLREAPALSRYRALTTTAPNLLAERGVNLPGNVPRPLGFRVLAPRVPALRERGGDETDARVVRTHGDSTARAAHARRMHSTFVHTQLYEMCVSPPGTLARI